ncbi:TetR/AcrR family transcriptional regulator [Olivibacter sp. SDN3]|uniref:TetR/AcrR family transcriptional regulator n=1 Tax=Olivibacter sp. SDN3 TaxID=2764720 RepID=UPI001650E7DA|nr:TetR/AcrR family transcriptional regulator [Olivibacter sp. SDN3]QNL48866.1 TetR/AcrR family transcriptional regulator [Olivibacter sp. SDN3]
MNVQLEATEKKENILNSMLELIASHGLQGVSMSSLAKKANVAAGTIYHYFESKDAMILELFQYVRTSINNEIFKIKDRITDNYKDRFQGIWMNLCQYYIAHPEVLSFMEQFYSSPFQKKIKDRDLQFRENSLTVFFKLGVDQKHIKSNDLHIISSIFIGSITIAAKKHINGYYPVTDKELRIMAAIIWDGLKCTH